MDQLTQIMKVTGVPGKEFIQKLDSPEVRRGSREEGVCGVNTSSFTVSDLLVILL